MNCTACEMNFCVRSELLRAKRTLCDKWTSLCENEIFWCAMNFVCVKWTLLLAKCGFGVQNERCVWEMTCDELLCTKSTFCVRNRLFVCERTFLCSKPSSCVWYELFCERNAFVWKMNFPESEMSFLFANWTFCVRNKLKMNFCCDKMNFSVCNEILECKSKFLREKWTLKCATWTLLVKWTFF